MKTCESCKFWAPRYFGVGECNRQARMHEKMWVSEDKAVLFTVKSFSCVEHETVPNAEEGTL